MRISRYSPNILKYFLKIFLKGYKDHFWILDLSHQTTNRTLYLIPAFFCNMCIYFGCFATFVPKEFLYIT
jgi:hypothetical protein